VSIGVGTGIQALAPMLGKGNACFVLESQRSS